MDYPILIVDICTGKIIRIQDFPESNEKLFTNKTSFARQLHLQDLSPLQDYYNGPIKGNVA